MKRVLQLPGSIEKRNGRMSVIMNVYRKIDRSKVQFDFACTDYGNDNYYREIVELGGKVFLIKKESIYNIRKLISELLSTNKYSFLHYHAISKWGIGLSIAHKYNVKVIVESHSAGLSDTFIKSVRNRIFSLNIFKYSNIRIAISEKAGKELFLGSKFDVIPNTINASNFKFDKDSRNIIRKKLGISENELLIGCVGRIAPVKNQEFSIRVLNQLDENYKLVFVGGEGSNLDRLKKLKLIIENYGLENRIIFTGEVQNVADYYSAFDVFWLPSLFEGLPTVALEATANGLSCILSNKITKEVQVSDFIHYLPITESSLGGWSDLTKNIVGVRDPDSLEKIIKSEFNFKRVLKKWNNLYNI